MIEAEKADLDSAMTVARMCRCWGWIAAGSTSGGLGPLPGRLPDSGG